MMGVDGMLLKTLRSIGLAAVLLACGAAAPSAAKAPARGAGADRTVTVSEGTQMAFALSPDHRKIVLDVQGVLFVMPASGGHAKAITDTLFDAHQPSWSPDGRRIAFQSNRDGHWRIWTAGADGSGPKPLTHDVYEEREPSWSPDLNRIAFTSDRSGKFDVWEMDLATGALRRRTTAPGGNSRPTWSPDGRQIAYVSDRKGDAGVYAVDEAGAERRLAKADVFSFGMSVPLGTPSWRPGSDAALYALIAGGKAKLMLNDQVIASDEDVHPFRAAWLSPDTVLYAADGHLKRRSLTTGAVSRIPFSVTLKVRPAVYRKKRFDFDSVAPRPVQGVQRAAISPDGRQVAFTALGGLWLAPIGQAPRRLTPEGPYAVVDPAWAPDGRAIAYASDRAGSLDIWVHDLTTGQDRRLTSELGAEMRPAWSPDGKTIAYVDAFGAYAETVRLIDAAGGMSRALDAAGESPGFPSWSPDSRSLMVSRLRNYSTSQSYYAGGENQYAIVPVAGGPARDVTLVADHSIGDRSGDGPAWSPDGKQVAFAMDAALWVAPVGPDGAGAGPPRKLADRIFTGMSWAGDSKTLLAQVGHDLVLFDTVSGDSRPVPLDLDWRPAKPTGLLTIHAGKLVDGVHPQALRDVDIVVDGARILSVAPHGRAPIQGRLIDASGLTVMPGLIDAHEHLIKEFGSSFGRLLLAYGVTTVRSPGNVPGDVLEEREAIDAGLRPGPRMFLTGYILDGERTVWEMGVTVRTPEEADRQVKLGAALGYDMIKSYVHTSEPMRARVVADAHRYGLPVSSHEIYPAAAFGSDSVEHLDGNGSSRGYSTKASELNIAYDDVAQILARSGMTVTPTVSLFTPPAELENGKAGTLDDPRWAAQPSWVREALGHEYVDPAAGVLVGNIRRSILKLHRAGARIIAGTDSPFSPIGLNTHNELEQEVRAGLTPFEALRSATTVPATLLGVDADLGTVQAGRLADLVFVEGDPLTDIKAARNVRQVMKNGRMFTVQELIGGGPALADMPASAQR